MIKIIPQLIAFILNFIIFILLIRHRKVLINYTFASVVLGILIWIFTVAIFPLLSNLDQLFAVAIVAYIGPILVASSLLFFSFIFPRELTPIVPFQKKIIFIGTIVAIIILFIPKFVLINIGSSDYSLVTGPGLYLLFFIIISFLIWALINLIKKYKVLTGIYQLQLKYLFLGISIASFLGIISNALLPLFNIYKFIWFGPFSTVILILFVYYAITKHHLMDIRFIVLRTITYSLVALLISATVVGLTLLLPEALGVSIGTKSLIAVLASIFIVLILEPLKKGIANATDKLFFKAKVDYQKLLAELGEVIGREIDLDVLLYSVARNMEQKLKIKNVSMYLAGVAGGAFYKRKGRLDENGQKIVNDMLADTNEEDRQDLEHKLAHNNPLVQYLRDERQVIVLEALERKIEDTQNETERKKLEASKEALDNLDAAVVAPIIVGDNLNAVMALGPKMSGDPFGSEDLQLLSLLSPQLASALDKSRLYDEVKQFSERLKKEVAIATEDLRNSNLQLQERNQFLSVLQNVTTLITRSLNFKEVTQSIADSIAKELGYIGGLVMFLGKDKHKLFPDAITHTPGIDKVLKLLPKNFSEFWGDYRQSQSRSVKSIRLDKVQIGTDFAEFISPAVPAELASKMQGILGIKTIVAVPIYYEGEPIGVIDFLMANDPSVIKGSDLSIMKALANQTGIVYRNIQLFNQVQQSNKELAEANEHLKQLDQAKSEFVSIASHQLRTPMAGIMGYLSMLTQGDFGKLPKEQYKVMEMLLQASQRMIQLINLFLDISKIESGKLALDMRPNHIEDIIHRVVEVLGKVADSKGLKLTFSHPKELLPEVTIDDKMFDVISNLVDNGIKYTEKGSIKVKAESDGKNILVTVKDTGRGIPQEEAKQLFGKFVRGSGMAQINPDGSGLGLYVARRITEAHGGKIWVESAGVGKGSSFILTLPLAGHKVGK